MRNKIGLQLFLGLKNAIKKHAFTGIIAARYVDLGHSSGFAAELRVDAQGLVLSYEHLFERVSAI